MMYRAAVAACCCIFLSLCELTGARQALLERRHFILGAHEPGEKVVHIVGAAATWYEDHQVELDLQYPTEDGGVERMRLSCIDVVIIYTPSLVHDEAGEELFCPRVNLVSGGPGETFAAISIQTPEVTFFNHSTIFYGIE